MLKPKCNENFLQLLFGISQISIYSEKIITTKDKNEKKVMYTIITPW